ncbi:MAG: DUF4870 domain-containing protein [Candidatus Aquicultor sp.]
MSETQNTVETSSTGLDPKLAAFLAYLFGIIGGIVFIAIEKDNRYVKFHAWQSVTFSVALFVAWIAYMILMAILHFIPLIGALIGVILWAAISIGGLVAWIILLIKAFSGEEYKLPFIGDFAEQRIQ